MSKTFRVGGLAVALLLAAPLASCSGGSTSTPQHTPEHIPWPVLRAEKRSLTRQWESVEKKGVMIASFWVDSNRLQINLAPDTARNSEQIVKEAIGSVGLVFHHDVPYPTPATGGD